MLKPQTLAEPFFKEVSQLGEFLPVEASDMPEAYQSLLAHHDHMTVTLEAWYNSLVDVHVLHEQSDPEFYSRASLLQLQRTGEAVQLGIVRIRLAELNEPVRLEIESRALPLGRILIRHHVMREVELLQLWRVNPGSILRSHLELPDDSAIYARTARIMVESKPAIELLEIVRK